MKLLLVIVLLSPMVLFSQTLGFERIKKIKECTVRIEVDSTGIMGTGFFINDIGCLLTCWHVIESAIKLDSVGKIKWIQKIYITLNSGERREVGIPIEYVGIGNPSAVGYDYCHLLPLDKFKTPFLKIGDFNKVQEGDEIYTCGFPIAIKQPFVTKGIISTVYTDSLNSIIKAGGEKVFMPKSVALLDITLNSGNSGGAIVKIGKTIDEDEVIGLADFMINPISKDYIELKKAFTTQPNYTSSGINQNAVFSYFTDILSKMSMGVSGCVSINHFLTSLNNRPK